MTMHLLPAYYTTSRLNRKKKKKINPARYENAWRKHNKFLKSIRCEKVTLEEYIDYVQGKVKPKKENTATYNPTTDSSYRRETPNIPSSNSVCGVATKKPIPVYTGNAVIGQAYNKGGLQVLSASEASDPMTGKRR